MAQGRFEDEIRKKMEGQVHAPSTRVWEKTEAMLNASLIQSHSASKKRYQWLAAACLLLAVLSIGYQVGTRSPLEQATDGVAYNPLRTHTFRMGSDIPDWSRYRPLSTFFPPLLLPNDQTQNADASGLWIAEEEMLLPPADANPILQVASKGHGIPEVREDHTIYEYVKAPAYLQRSKSNPRSDQKAWAGIIGGAGNFNTRSTQALASQIDPISLATAVGNDGFINPQLAASADLERGMATNIGLDFGMNLGRKWTMEAGLTYTNATSMGEALINVVDAYTIGGVSDFPTEGEALLPLQNTRETEILVEENYEHQAEISRATQFTSIPVKAGYYIVDGQVSLRLSMGVAANYLVTSELSGDAGIINEVKKGTIDQWSFDGLGALEIGYSVSDHFKFTLAPNYRRAITSMDLGSGSNTTRFLIQTGIQYRIQ